MFLVSSSRVVVGQCSLRSDEQPRARLGGPFADWRHGALCVVLSEARLSERRCSARAGRLRRCGDPGDARREAGRFATARPRGHEGSLRRLPEELGTQDDRPQHRPPARSEPAVLLQAEGVVASCVEECGRLPARRLRDLYGRRPSSAHHGRERPQIR